MHSIEIARQRYLDGIHRYLQGRLDVAVFRERLRSQWAQDREGFWRFVWEESRTQRCEEREQLVKGVLPFAPPSDPRRFPRMLDRLCTLCIEGGEEEPFRAAVAQVLAAYRSPGSDLPEARFVDYPPRFGVFERPLPPGRSHRYPCTLEDIRAQLARVPEYDLEGLWAVGLYPSDRERANTYGCYYRRFYPVRKPVILLYSVKGEHAFRLRYATNAAKADRRMWVERQFGMEFDSTGRRIVCRWKEENDRRYISEHVLLHEIGHHVQLRQRWRERLNSRLPSHFEEWFAELYANRFRRESEDR